MKTLTIDGTARGVQKRRLAAAVYAATSQTDALRAELVFVSEDEIRTLNRETRGVDAVTDVLSYPTLSGICGRAVRAKEFPTDFFGGRVFLGSIAVCRARARQQAKEYGHSLNRELHYLIAHGLLHLLGYDHIEEADKRKMREKEEQVMTAIGVGRETE